MRKSAQLEISAYRRSAHLEIGEVEARDDQAGDQGPCRRGRVAGSGRGGLPRSGRDQDLRCVTGRRIRPDQARLLGLSATPWARRPARATVHRPGPGATPTPGRPAAGRGWPWPARVHPATRPGPSGARSGTSPGSSRLPGGVRAASAPPPSRCPSRGLRPCPAQRRGGPGHAARSISARRRPGTRGEGAGPSGPCGRPVPGAVSPLRGPARRGPAGAFRSSGDGGWRGSGCGRGCTACGRARGRTAGTGSAGSGRRRWSR